MSANERFNVTLQENIVTCLAYNVEHGRIVANQLEPTLLEGDFRIIAERCIDYWREYNEPPRDHTADLVADIINDKLNRRAKSVTRILRGMVALSETINTQYVMNQIQTFGRLQRFKAAIISSAEKIQANAQMALPEIEELWHGLLRQNEKAFNAGMDLFAFERVLERMETRASEFTMGIDQLDTLGVVPARGQLTCFLASAGRGKSWALVHVGAKALMQRQKVVHITLEMDEEEVGQRYYQQLFSIPKRESEIEYTKLTYELGELTDIGRERVKPSFALDGPLVRQELANHATHFGTRFSNIKIKRFTPNSLTPNGLRAYLDTLEQTEGFIPDILVLDYLGIMKVDAKDKRGSMGLNALELRAIMIERNIAGVTAHQSSKAGEMSVQINATHMAEDWSIVGTLDTIITYSCSEREFRYGLARLFVAKCRGERDRFSLLITQSYDVGQFCIQSHFLGRNYFDMFKEFATAEGDGGDDDDEGAGDDD